MPHAPQVKLAELPPFPRDVVVLFLKNPEPGRVKTRLAKAVGAPQAAAIFRLLVEETIAHLPPSLVPVVFFDPPEKEAAVRHWLADKLPVDTLFLAQLQEGDLGARMKAAFGEVFRRGAQRAVIVGTDCVDVRSCHYEAALAALTQHDAVMGPTHDGGYYLLGMRRVQDCLFDGIRWSHSETRAQSLRQAKEAGCSVDLIEMLHDVDEVEDWQRVKNRFPDL